MDPITIAIILLAAGTVIYFWGHIAHFLQTRLIPLVRNLLGNSIGNLFTNLVVFLDRGVCVARELVVRGWRAFKTHVLGMKTRIQKLGPNVAQETTESYVRTADNRVVKQTVVQELAWHDIPLEIREKMMREQTTAAEFDSLQVVERRMRQQCAAAGILELSVGS